MSARQTTPKKISTQIKQFLANSGLSRKPIFLLFSHADLAYRPKYCLDNCEAEQIKIGCEVVYGWVIWENRRRRFIEGEFHSVVRKNGGLADVTPRVDLERRVLFVEDPNRKPKRIDESTWQTWTNIKSRNGKIIEECREIRIRNLGPTVSEFRALSATV